MHLEALVTWLFVGLAAGSLAGFLIRPGGYGWRADLLLGRQAPSSNSGAMASPVVVPAAADWCAKDHSLGATVAAPHRRRHPRWPKYLLFDA